LLKVCWTDGIGTQNLDNSFVFIYYFVNQSI
jgi:hypothetical protein